MFKCKKGNRSGLNKFCECIPKVNWIDFVDVVGHCSNDILLMGKETAFENISEES
jgi:hypothetical protein